MTGRCAILVAALVAGLVPVLSAPAQAVPGSAVAAAARGVDDATATLQGMTLEQRVGQVFLVGTPATGVAAATVSAVVDRHVGGVMLTGRSTAGAAATAAVAASLQSLTSPAATAAVPLLVATDQEGGRVQVLQGPGLSTIPTALVQGASPPAELRAAAAGWGRELRASGVDVDLAPVLDTVPGPAAAAGNPPIGVFDREYGYTPEAVTAAGGAFARGLADAGVVAAVKHFPGLGRVTGNPDTTAGVTDTVTVRHDPYLSPFQAAVDQGVPMLMVSTAYYARIDPAHPAAFSSTVLHDLVRGDLGFRGVVVSDDLANAQQVVAWSPGDRALQFLSAGGDLVLTVDPGQLPAMYDAVLAQARVDGVLRARVQQAALRVLRVKQARGLLPHGGLGLIGAKYQALGGPRSYLGDPVSPQYATPDGVTQDFAGGTIAWSPDSGAHAVRGAILVAYRAAGGPGGPLGYPTTDERSAAQGRGRASRFNGSDGATIAWSPTTGAHVVHGAILSRWQALRGAGGPLGFPTTDEGPTGVGDGRANDFDGSGGGSLSWTPATGAHAVYGAIRVRWLQLAREQGPLGPPTTDEADTRNHRGRYNDFVSGRITWHAADGSVTVVLY